MFRNKELFMQRGMIMHQSDIERFAFLFLCGKRDRAILLEKEKMTFSDLDRLTYVTDFLGLTRWNLDIWNHYGEQFQEHFQRLEQLYDETCSIVSCDKTEIDLYLQDRWIQEFCNNVPDRKIRKELKELVKKIYKEKGMEIPEETGII